MSFKVRKAASADSGNLLALMEEGRLQKLAHNDNTWGDEPYTSAEAQARIHQGDTYIAEIDDQPAGCITLLFHDERMWGAENGAPHSAGYIHGMVASRAFHGQHVGEKLMFWAADQTRAAGLDKLRLDCPADNAGLCAYYERNGFTRIGTTQVHESNSSALYEQILQK